MPVYLVIIGVRFENVNTLDAPASPTCQRLRLQLQILKIGSDLSSHLDDRSMDSVNSSCTGKKLGCVSGGDDERRLKRKLNVGNDAGSKDKAQTASSGSVEIAVSPGSSSSGNSVDIDSEVSGKIQESSTPIGLASDENVPVSTQVREESRVIESLNTISDSIVGEGGSLGTVIKSQSFKGMNEATHTSKKRTPPSKMQWPKWPVLHMVRLSNMEKVMNYYRVLNLGKDMDDKDLLCFLEEQLAKEKAGLSKTTITNRLRTKLHESAAAGEPDSCSICMGEYKEQDEIANLYYCSHQYHAECIKEWLPKNNLCPMCRALAIIPEEYPAWDGDVRLHQAFFVHLKYAAA